MSMLRKLLVWIVLGLVVGGAAGVGWIYWQKKHPTVTDRTDFSAYCTGGSVPAVIVEWPALLDAEITGLQRSVDGGPWAAVFSSQSPEYKKYFFRDNDVRTGTRYWYKIAVDGKDVTPVVAITTNPGDCLVHNE